MTWNFVPGGYREYEFVTDVYDEQNNTITRFFSHYHWWAAFRAEMFCRRYS